MIARPRGRHCGLLLALAVAMMPVAGHAGEDVQPAARPRVVSLGPAVTEQVLLLDCADSLVGVTTYCQLPEGHPPIPHVGTVTGISAEQIVALQPDLVLAISLTHPRDVEALERIGLRVVRFGYARDFDDICTQFIALGDLLGASDRAAAIVAASRERVRAAETRVAGREPVSVFVEVGARPLFTVGRESFIHDMITRAGGVNIGADSGSGMFSRERVIAANPDVIVVVTMGITAAEERAAWRAVTALSAVAAERVHVMDADSVCSPTPPRFAQSTEQLASLLHPEAAVEVAP